MKTCYPTIVAICLATSSCDKVKSLTEKAKATVASEVARKSVGTESAKPDPGLQKLVDQTPEGAIFRKDLPFPKQIEVKITRRQEISGRFSEKSELGSQVSNLKGTITDVSKLTRDGDKVSYTLLESIFTEPVVKGADKDEKPVSKQLAPPSAPFDFVKSGSTWKSAVASDFRTASRAQLIAPVFDELLVEGALAPRSLWFGKKRHKVGDTLAVTGEFLPMLVAGKSKGKLNITLESFDAVNGHPCGVFSISGDFSRKNFPDFNGSLADEDVTIESGKFWLSLLYPVILREEVAIIKTSTAGGQGGLSTSGRSSANVSVVREWKGSGK